MLAAEPSEIAPNNVANFQCVRGSERLPPLLVILKGLPNGFTAALTSVAEIAKAAMA